MTRNIVFLIMATITLTGCDRNKEQKRRLHFKIDNLVQRSYDSISYLETVYVPVYTDVFHVDQSRLFPLTVTLSLRNTSLSDTLNIYKVNYYNSDGKLKTNHISDSGMLRLRPLESYDLVINKLTYTGDTGANYIIDWGSKSQGSDLLVQALMISTSGQQGLSFITEGKVISSQSINR